MGISMMHASNDAERWVLGKFDRSWLSAKITGRILDDHNHTVGLQFFH